MAYQEIKPKISNRHNLILEVLRRCGAFTDYEIARVLGKSDPNFVRPRRRELVKMGLVFKAGKRECSVTRKLANVWLIGSWNNGTKNIL